MGGSTGCVLCPICCFVLQMGDLTLLPDGTAFLCNGAQIGRALYPIIIACSIIYAIESNLNQQGISV